MPRLAIFNMFFGFLVLFLAAAAGAFIATDLSSGYLQDKAFLDTWVMVLDKSAHGHTNLFALMHIAFGLTMPYSVFSNRVKLWQTIGFVCGTLAMGPGLLVRARLGPTAGTDVNEIVVGVLLSCTLVALFTHAAGLGAKLYRRS